LLTAVLCTLNAVEKGKRIALINYENYKEEIDKEYDSYDEYDKLSTDIKALKAEKDDLDSNNLDIEDLLYLTFYGAESQEDFGFGSFSQLKRFKNLTYVSINHCFRRKNCSESTKIACAKIKDAFQKRAPKTKRLLRVYRGIKDISKMSKDLKVGQVLTDKAVMSTSMGDDVAWDFASTGEQPVVLQINLPKGTPFLYSDFATGKELSDVSNEYEILLKPDSKLKIRKIIVDELRPRSPKVIEVDYINE
jgi:hypothetical protein